MRPKRLISLLVAVCMMITMLPLSAVTAFAADTSASPEYKINIGDYEYDYTINADGETATITDFHGPVASANNGSYKIEIPAKFGDYTVTDIGSWAFDGCPLTTLSLGKNIKTIGDYAFDYCIALKSVTIPQSVTSIGKHAFDGCHSLDSLAINGAIESMGKQAFDGCISLKTLKLGENIKTIGNYAFRNCISLTNVTIPEKVTTIGPGTFSWCTHLESITLPAGLKFFKDDLTGCPAGCVIYYKDYKTAADALRDNNVVLQNDILAGHNFLYLCKVTFDANGGDLTGKGGNLTNYLTDNLTDHAEVPVYKTEKITATEANDLEATDLDAINHPTVRVTISSAGTPPKMASPKMAISFMWTTTPQLRRTSPSMPVGSSTPML